MVSEHRSFQTQSSGNTIVSPSNRRGEIQTLKKDYLSFISSIYQHKQIVSIDEKPMKFQDIYSLARRDPATGIVPHNTGNANLKNRYNSLTACSLKIEKEIG